MYLTQQLVIDGFRVLYEHTFGGIIAQRLKSVETLQASFYAFNKQYIHQLKKLNPNSYSELLKLQRRYLSQILEFNRNAYHLQDNSPLLNDLHSFEQQCTLFFEQIPVFITQYETDQNRNGQEDDGRISAFRKRLKRWRFTIHSFFRKKDCPPRYKRKVPLRNYHIDQLYLNLAEELWAVYSQILQVEAELMLECKAYTAQIESLFEVKTQPEISAIQNQLEAFQHVITASEVKSKAMYDKVAESIRTLLIPAITTVQGSYYKLGTFEGKSLRNRNQQITKGLRIKHHQVKTILKSWDIRLFSLSEDWSFDTDLYLVKNKALMARLSMLNSGALGRSEKVVSWIADARKRVVKANTSLLDVSLISNDFVKYLDEQRARIALLMNDEENSLSKIHQKETIPYAISSIEEQLSHEINSIKDKRMIVKGEVVAHEMKLSDMAPVYLRELLQFEIFPAFKLSLDIVKKLSTESIVDYENNIHNLAHVVDYNFDTVRMLILSDEADREERARQVIQDGIVQFEQKVDQLASQVEKAFREVLEAVELALGTLIDDLILLTENEKVSELRMRLLRAKAINRTELWKQQLVASLQKAYVVMKPLWQLLLRRGSHLTEQITQIYGDGEAQSQINTDISNFLTETKNSLERMPYLYQRLFKLEPIDEGYLFFERSAELSILAAAYDNWQKDRFSAVSIIGEKGSGITSLLHYSIKKASYETVTVDLSLVNQIYQVGAFIELLGGFLHFSEPSTKDTLIQRLLDREQRMIIVLEGLQHMYLKKVDGFDCLKMLFEVMSKTNQKVFWITSCTLHAWNYLQKVLTIGEYFGYVVPLGEFSNDEMVEIVLKRHNVSGYDLKFLPGSADLSNRKLNRLPEAQQQKQLQRQYFTQLNQLAKGNLSVAFIFWMRSLQKIEGNVMHVSSMADFKADFIKALAREKLFCLHALLLHDGLNVADFCKTMRYLPEAGQMKLFQMEDDGLLLNFKQRYVVNLLLYRPMINALKAHNLLH